MYKRCTEMSRVLKVVSPNPVGIMWTSLYISSLLTICLAQSQQLHMCSYNSMHDMTCYILLDQPGGGGPPSPYDGPTENILHLTLHLYQSAIQATIENIFPSTVFRNAVLAPFRNLTHLTFLHVPLGEITMPSVIARPTIQMHFAEDAFHQNINLKILEINLPNAHQQDTSFDSLNNLLELETLKMRFLSSGSPLTDITKFVANSPLKRLLLGHFHSQEKSSQNEINFTKWLKMLQGGSLLEELDISYNHIRYLTSGLIKFAPNLQRLDISGNFIILPTVASLDILCHPSLKVVDASEQSKPQQLLSSKPLNEKALQEFLCSLDATGACSPWNVTASSNHPDCFGGVVVPMGPKLREIHFKHVDPPVFELQILHFFGIPGICVYSSNPLLSIDMSDNRQWAHHNLSIGQLHGHGLGHLNLDNTGLTLARLHSLDKYVGLKTLRFCGNELTTTITSNASLFLAHNQQLQSLSLSNNSLAELSERDFTHLTKLEKLDLSQNKLTDLPFRVTALSSLIFLDISNNKLGQINQKFRKGLSKLATTRDQIEVDISHNPLSCHCENIGFVEWFQESKIMFLNSNETECRHSSRGWIRVKNVDIKELQKACFPPSVPLIAVSTVLCVVLLAVAIFLVWKYRWTLRYWCYRRFGQGARQVEFEMQNYRYDGFIAYSSEDRGWVHHALVQEMEEKRGLRLHIYMRDLLAGGVLADRITTAMEECRKTVLVISPNFLASEWCQFDMHLAETRLMAEGIDVVVPVLLTDIPMLGINQAVKRIMQTHECLKWTDDPDGQKMFWDKLKRALLTDPANPLRA